MSDKIYRQDAIIQLSHNKKLGDDEWEIAVNNDIQTIKQLPPAEPERKTGRWIDDGSELGCACSECGASLDEYISNLNEYNHLIKYPRFCPNCGSDNSGGGA